MQIGNLTVRLGVDADTFKVKDFVHAIGELPFSVASGITALTGMSFAITDLFKDTLGLANNLTMFKSITGQSADELQRWNLVAKGLGLNADVVQGSIESMIKTMAALKNGGAVDEGFMRGLQMLGVGMDPLHPFAMLRRATVAANKLGPTAGAFALGLMHIDPTLIASGALSDKDFTKRGAGGVILDQEGIQVMKSFQIALGSFEVTLEKSFIPAILAVTPIMGTLADSLSDLIKQIGPSLARGAPKVISNIGSLVGLATAGILPWEEVFDNFSHGLLYRRNHEWGEKQYSHMQITNNIHSNGDAFAVANIVNQFTAQYHRKAASAFNNGGR